MRLRRGWLIRDDDNGSAEPTTGIDEQEQDEVIARLSADDARVSSIFRIALLVISACGALYFMLAVSVLPVAADQTALSSFPLVCTLGVSSLMLSFTMVYDIPIATVHRLRTRPPSDLRSASADDPLKHAVGWLRSHALFVNAGACGTMAVRLSLVYYHHSPADSPIIFPSLLVFLVYIICLIGQRELQPIDTTKLKAMKYDLKGA